MTVSSERCYLNISKRNLAYKRAYTQRREKVKDLDLLFGFICPECFKVITVHVAGKPGEEVAVARHGGVVCAPAPLASAGKKKGANHGS